MDFTDLSTYITDGFHEFGTLFVNEVTCIKENKQINSMIRNYDVHASTDVSRRQYQNVTHFVKNVNIVEFGYFIWNPYEKCIQKSPNMPGIGSLLSEIAVKMSEI